MLSKLGSIFVECLLLKNIRIYEKEVLVFFFPRHIYQLQTKNNNNF